MNANWTNGAHSQFRRGVQHCFPPQRVNSLTRPCPCSRRPLTGPGRFGKFMNCVNLQWGVCGQHGVCAQQPCYREFPVLKLILPYFRSATPWIINHPKVDFSWKRYFAQSNRASCHCTSVAAPWSQASLGTLAARSHATAQTLQCVCHFHRIFTLFGQWNCKRSSANLFPSVRV